MALVEQDGILVAVKQLDFKDKNTGDPIVGVKLILLRESLDPRFDGYGFVPFDLTHMGEKGLEKIHSFLSQAKGLFMKKVIVECDAVMSGKNMRLYPLNILPAE